MLTKLITLFYRALRGCYHRLPVSHDRKLWLKNRFIKLFPGTARLLPGYQAWTIAADAGGPVSNTGSVIKRGSGPILPETENLDTLLSELSAFFGQKPWLPEGRPRVSIVIPVYGQIDYTLMCLQSIASCSARISFETIVVDDKSPDNSLEILQKITGLTVIANTENQGFIRTCNAGAAEAKGEFLVFLNNDVEVENNWLDELIGSFDCFASAGLVGAKLVYPDGTLQEAGGIIWNDGSAWNLGRNSDPGLPEFNYLRETDYCSGACIAIPTKLFEEVGRFDEHYLPAYGEDSDLAFKVRKAGKKVYYQSMSSVIHYEGVTSGTDTSQGVKSYQVENAKKLYERWAPEMALLQNPGENIADAKDKNRLGRIMVVDHCTPTPDRDAGSITALNIMRLLVGLGYKVTFVPEDNLLYMPGYTHALQRMGIEVLYLPFVSSVKNHMQEVGHSYNAVMLFRPLVAERHLDDIERYCSNAKVIYHASDLHFLRNQREAALNCSQTKAEKVKIETDTEIDYFRRADAAIVHSTVEAEILKNDFDLNNVHVFPWAIDIRGTERGFEERADICFVGSYQHPPNIDAALHFIKDIFPLVLEKLPNLKFHAIGSNPPEELLQLQSDSVVVPGFIADLDSYLDQIKVATAPLRYGAGIKGKIGTTLSLGLPCVATTVAAEGMQLTDNVDISIADAPANFADKIIELCESEEKWKSMSESGISFANKMYGMQGGFKIMADILHAIELPGLQSMEEVPAILKHFSDPKAEPKLDGSARKAPS